MPIRSIFALAFFACASSPAPPPPTVNTNTGGLEHSMANCPSALETAVTRVEDVPDGVLLTITATDRDDLRRLYALAEIHARIGGPDGSAPQHSGMHGGPGDIGHCPVVHEATMISYTRIPNGIQLHVRALLAKDIPALRRDTRERNAGLPTWLARER